MFIIYALMCPKCGCPRYVGQSSKGLKRHQEHLLGMKCRDSSIHKKRWVQKLLDQGLKPSFHILLELPDATYLDAAEIYWIAEMRRRGLPLTNLTDGGGGTKGWVPSTETRRRQSEALKGRPVPQDRRAKISATLTGRPSPKKGRPLTPTELAKHAVAHAVPPFKDQHGRVYKTIKEASDRWSIPPGNIVHCLKGRRKSAGGLEFSYI